MSKRKKRPRPRLDPKLQRELDRLLIQGLLALVRLGLGELQPEDKGGKGVTAAA